MTKIGTDFDKLTLRRGTNSYKWDEPEEEDVIPMWVADMDFETAPCITEALHQRVNHGIFGYTQVPDSYYEATTEWFARRHGWNIQREWILYTSGVVPALSATIKALAKPGDRIIIQTPVYNCFFSSIRNNGCEVIENSLTQTADGTYAMDFDDLERKCADPKTQLLILCNPHNPVGRVWQREELRRIGEICLHHGVRVLADEIHCELVMPGHHYIPFASVSQEFQDNSITFCSPSKAFNIAGLQIANIICNDADIRRRIDRAININEVCDVNPFGIVALEAAYRQGESWLEDLNAYLWNNYQILCRFFKEHLPQITITPLEGTYLVWADISATGLDADTLTERLLHQGRIMVSRGTIYGQRDGRHFIRINIACPRERMLEGLRRIRDTLQEDHRTVSRR